MIKNGSKYVCDPRPQERVLAVHPDAVCRRAAPGLSMWRVVVAGRVVGKGYTAAEAWDAAAKGLPNGEMAS